MSSYYGLYEPIHGSAPDIAGMGKANPCGMILSVAMMLRLSFNREDAALAIENAVESVFKDGFGTSDLAHCVKNVVSTSEFADLVVKKIASL